MISGEKKLKRKRDKGYKGKLFTALLLCLLPGLLWADIGREGYQCAKWGMSINQVKKCFPNQEWKTISTHPDILMFKHKIDNENAYFGFKFKDNKLYQVRILLDIEAIKNSTYLEKFNKLEKFLENKYGAPQKKYRKAISNPFIDKATLIAAGQGYYQTFWKTQETEILLTLIGENGKLLLSIQYSGISFPGGDDKKRIR
jgi:hypothetical protein